jgi:hypothetical protein
MLAGTGLIDIAISEYINVVKKRNRKNVIVMAEKNILASDLDCVVFNAHLIWK